MSAHSQYDADYPYAAQAAGGVIASDGLPGWWSVVRETLRRWTRRLAVVAAIAGVLLLMAAGVVAYRLIAQASHVAELRAHGCEVTFLHQLPGETDPLPAPVRTLLGDDVYSEIAGVAFVGGRFNLYWQYQANDMWAIGRECARLDKLRSFSMISEAFTFEQMSSWPQLDQLEELEIHSNQLTDKDLDRIRRMGGLKHLKLGSSSISSGAVQQLAALPALETLELRSIRNANARAVDSANRQGGFAAVQRLVIESAEIDDAMILGLGPFPELREVVLSHAQIGDRGLAHLLSGGNVHSIVLNDPVDDFEQAAAVRCPGPRSFHLLGTPITGTGLAPLAGQEVTGFVLDQTSLSDEGLATIGKVTDLRDLSLRETKVTGTGMRHLASMRTLSKVDLSGCPLTREGLAALAQLRLFQLNVTKTPLTDADLMLFENCDTITRLIVSETKVTPNGVKALYEARKRRLQPSGRQEPLIVDGDFLEVTEAYVDPLRLRESDPGGDDPAGNDPASAYFPAR